MPFVLLILLLAAAFFTNALLVVLILSRDVTRKRAINLQIVNLSATACLRALAICVNLLWTTADSHTCRMLNFLQLWAPALTHLILLLLNIDRFLAVLFPKRYANLTTKWYSALMLLGPLVLTFILYMGLILGGEQDTEYSEYYDGRCIVFLKNDVSRALITLSFAVPMILVFVLGVTTIAAHAIKSRKNSTELLEDMPEGRIHTLVALGLVDGLYIVMWLPIYVYVFIMNFCDEHPCMGYMLLDTEWLSYANLVIMPFLWAIHRDIRLAFKRFCCCICQLHSASSGDHDNIVLTSPDVTDANGVQK